MSPSISRKHKMLRLVEGEVKSKLAKHSLNNQSVTISLGKSVDVTDLKKRTGPQAGATRLKLDNYHCLVVMKIIVTRSS